MNVYLDESGDLGWVLDKPFNVLRNVITSDKLFF